MNLRHTLTITGVMLVIWAPSSQAYIDPATGSILVQGLLAAIAGALAFVRLKWTMVKGWFNRDEPPAQGLNDVVDDKRES